MLWRPLALAALNQPADQAAAAVFARVLSEMFNGDSRGASIALPAKPLHLMYAEPARQFIEARGGEVHTGAAARVTTSADRLEVHANGRRWTPRAVISAVPWFTLSEVFESPSPVLVDLLDRAAHMASSPIVTVNLWFDRLIFDEPFIGLPGRTMQWVFDKRTLFGQSASHLSIVSSGAEAIAGKANDELIALAMTELAEALPEIRSAKLLRSTVVRERRATFSLAPGQPKRPGCETPIPGLYLAGDWIDTGLPATIESAVRSGHRAADLASTPFQ